MSIYVDVPFWIQNEWYSVIYWLQLRRSSFSFSISFNERESSELFRAHSDLCVILMPRNCVKLEALTIWSTNGARNWMRKFNILKWVRRRERASKLNNCSIHCNDLRFAHIFPMRKLFTKCRASGTHISHKRCSTLSIAQYLSSCRQLNMS